MLISYVRTILLYLILIASVRLMGKRQIGEMEPAEFVVTMLIANLAAIPMQDSGVPLHAGLVPILTVLGVQLVLAYLSMGCIPVRKLLCGKPVILIEEGKVRQKALRDCRITLDELQEHLRERGILALERVQYAVLETNGQISVVPYPRYQPVTPEDLGLEPETQGLPVTLVSDGRLLRENLRAAGVDRAWVLRALWERGSTQRGTFLLTLDGTGKICHIPREAAR